MKALMQAMLFANFFAVALDGSCQAKQSELNSVTYFSVDSLIGKWVSYSIEWDERKVVSKNKVIETVSQIHCNVCPEVAFKADSTATVKSEESNGQPELNFLWGTRGNNLVVHSIIKGKSNRSMSAFLPDGLYSVNCRTSKLINAHKEVVLTSKNGSRYILTRSSE